MFKKIFKYGSGPSWTEIKYGRRYRLYISLMIFLLVILLIIGAMVIRSMINMDPYMWFLFFLVLAIIPIFWLITRVLENKIIKNDYTYGSGVVAEELTGAKLTTLGDNYGIIHDVSKGKKKGNVDHIVVGPTGVFVIETKANTKDEIFYYYANIRRLTKFGYKFTKQAAENALWVHNCIKEFLGIDIWVYGIVARPFKNNQVIKSFCKNNVCVVDGDEVCGYIKNFDGRLSREEIKQIENLFNKIRRSNNQTYSSIYI